MTTSDQSFLNDISTQAAEASKTLIETAQNLMRLAASCSALSAYALLTERKAEEYTRLSPRDGQTRHVEEPPAPKPAVRRSSKSEVTRSSDKLKPGTRVYIKSMGVWGYIFRSWRNAPGFYRVDAEIDGVKKEIKAEASDLSLTAPKEEPKEAPKAEEPKAPEPPKKPAKPKAKAEPKPTKQAEANAQEKAPESPIEHQRLVYQRLLVMNPTPEKPVAPKDLTQSVKGLTMAPAYKALLDLAKKGIVSLSETGMTVGIQKDVPELVGFEEGATPEATEGEKRQRALSKLAESIPADPKAEEGWEAA